MSSSANSSPVGAKGLHSGTFDTQIRLLIVDDEPAILFTMSEMLQLHGFSVETAASGQTAKAALESVAFAAVITDVRMETPTAGYEVIEFSKKRNPRPATIVMSAYPDFNREWKAHGAQAFFEKPVPMPALVHKIEELLIQDRVLRHA